MHDGMRGSHVEAGLSTQEDPVTAREGGRGISAGRRFKLGHDEFFATNSSYVSEMRARGGNTPEFFVFQPYFRKIFTFRPINDLNTVLDSKLGAMSCNAELTRLGATDHGAKLVDVATPCHLARDLSSEGVGRFVGGRKAERAAAQVQRTMPAVLVKVRAQRPHASSCAVQPITDNACGHPP